jgi:hypothetical protein
MILTESTFLLFASKYYDNPNCTDTVEFYEDLKRFQYLRKLFGRYKQDNDLKERLILNHLIVIYNIFGPEATNMLFMKLHEYHEFLKPFVVYLNFMPSVVSYDEYVIHKDSIESDKYISELLKGI